uniref:Uncharacterized protein n=1 Tax=Oryza brachyantha TaxID=4533 RepID=J3LPE4_ORYBR
MKENRHDGWLDTSYLRAKRIKKNQRGKYLVSEGQEDQEKSAVQGGVVDAENNNQRSHT